MREDPMTPISCCALAEITEVAKKSLRGARPPRLSESDGGQAESDAAISTEWT
jgi:hypothetical protein